MTQGTIDRFVKQLPAPEMRKRKAQEWLERMYNQSD